MTISGSNFTSSGLMIFDSFEGAASGNIAGQEPEIHQGAQSAYSAWTQSRVGGTGNIVRDGTSPKARSTYHARVNMNQSAMTVCQLYNDGIAFGTGDELYISFYYRSTKTSANYPRQSKAWIAYPDVGDDVAYFSTAYDNCESGGWRTHITQNPPDDQFGLSGPAINGEWVRFENWLKQSAPSTANGQWETCVYRPTLGTPAKITTDRGSTVMRTASDDWTWWGFLGSYYSMCGSGDTATLDMDEFFLGGSRARVEIINTSTWAARTLAELQVPTAWSASEITIGANNLGHLGDSGTAYVVVIDSSGNVSTPYAITLGGGGGGLGIPKAAHHYGMMSQ